MDEPSVKPSVKAVGWARSLPLSTGANEARRWTRGHLEALGWTRTASDKVDDVTLIVSELVTNAHVHARSPAQLVLTWDDRWLQVSVHDASGRLPVAMPPSEERPGGRGMALVDALADAWEARRSAEGKTVTVCIHGPGRDDTACPLRGTAAVGRVRSR